MSRAALPRVFRLDEPEGPAVEFASLIAAVAEPPLSPEAEIRGVPGGCLAEADAFDCRWNLTAWGRRRIELEACGADADAILATVLREDFAPAKCFPSEAPSGVGRAAS